jgi:GMP synthase-like glutamine amidotransferase
MGLQFHPEVTAKLLRSWVSEADGRGALADAERRALLASRDGIPDTASPQQSGHLFTAFASRAGLNPQTP